MLLGCLSWLLLRVVGWRTKVQCCMSHVQVTVPSLQSRSDHSATAFSLGPGQTEITLFGGYSEWPSNLKSFDDFTLIANTTVLRFGEYTSCVLYCRVMRWKHRLLLCVMLQGCSSRGRELNIVSDYECDGIDLQLASSMIV